MLQLRLLATLAMPLLIVLGAVVAWLNRGAADQRPAWRDDSLDAWRRERDAAAEAERRRRQAAEERDKRDTPGT